MSFCYRLESSHGGTPTLLIDAHVHAFPDRLAEAVRAALFRDGSLTAGPLLPEVARRVREDGFDAAWVLPYAHRPGIAESLNEWSAREVARYRWLVAGATFHPGDEDLERLVKTALVDHGLRVVKLHCSVGQFSVADPRLDALWRAAEARHVPVVVHAGRRGPGGTEADELDELVAVLEAHPRLRLVMAHTGNPSFARALELMARFPNLSADLTPVWDRPAALTAGDFDRFPGRFFFGSDAPNNPVSAAEQRERWREVIPSDQVFESVMGGAAQALIPLEGAGK